ncbi:hypothetical protein BD770DRAFT_402985 [Pilaira anomala]|nr:hypothetical protein BD770DRAFT_402985 [Pilaira anomala]
MSNISERVFIFGGTGNIGSKLVKDLLEKNVPVTLYARTQSKVESMFPQGKDLIKIVQGDFSDLSTLKEDIKGHTRLFLLNTDFKVYVELKTNIAKIAYEAGVKQIVDISSFTVNLGWRTCYIGATHYAGEHAIYNLPNRGKFVALRPGRFMSNVLMADRPSPEDKIYDITDPNVKQGFISTNDIGAVAAVVLTEDIEKHGDAVYTLIGDPVTPIERAQIISDIVGRKISYQQIPATQKYKNLMASGHFSHIMAVDLSSGLNYLNEPNASPEISILLGREPETLKEYLHSNKEALI